MAACANEESPRLDRRLAAVAFVDVVGYSILMARDETRTHQQWMKILDEIIRPSLAKRYGKLIKSTGDGVLVEFISAFDAVAWALEVQRGVTTVGTAPEPGLALRIAVHIGEIIATDLDVFGDGVNLAARLQEHAPPGGIAISETVYELLRGSLASGAQDLGTISVKNMGEVRAYAFFPETTVSVPVRPAESKLPSIAVLPLQNLGGDAADEYFSDGIVEDITLSLAGLRELMVISRGSTLAFRGRQPDPREVGQVFGVRYVLMGSVRRSDRLVRVSVELCDADNRVSLWRERADVAPGDLFDMQDNLVARIVAGIAPNVRAAELRAAMRKKPENFTAYDCTLRGLHVIGSLDSKTFMEARDYLNRAMELDPNFAMPVAWLARWYNLYVGQGWSPEPEKDRAKAIELAAKAIELDPQNALALATYGFVKSFLYRDYDTALSYFDRALSACPNHALAWFLSSPTLSYVGRSEQAMKNAQEALRLSPLDRSLFAFYSCLNLAHYSCGNYEEAVRWGKMSASENPAYTANLRYLIAALAALGRADEARATARKLTELEPSFRLEPFATRQPFRDVDLGAKFIEHLRKAGVPD
jgi:adenylate cyclase